MRLMHRGEWRNERLLEKERGGGGGGGGNIGEKGNWREV